MTMDPDSNPIPTAVKELLALFDGPLSEVRFPDVDGAALREQVASVDAAVKDVEAAAAAWAEAKREVDARLEVLLQKAQRALAYARVYAEGKPELDAQLASLVFPKWGDPRGTKAAAPEPVAARKRGRPKKTEAAPAPKAEPRAEPAVTLLPAPASAPEPEAATPVDATPPADAEPEATAEAAIESEPAPESEAAASGLAAKQPAPSDDDATASAAE